MKERLDRKFEAIAAGVAMGHLRGDLATDTRMRFVVVKPFVIAFDPSTRRIIRVVHDHRDFGALFGGA